MLFFLILGLLVGAITVIFALQNVVTIGVTFLAWQINGSLALILLLAVLAGVLICALVSIPEMISTHMAFNDLKKKNRQLEDEIYTYRKVADDTARAQARAEAARAETRAGNII
jgi:lipopolysaccharide assembly protein A